MEKESKLMKDLKTTLKMFDKLTDKEVGLINETIESNVKKAKLDLLKRIKIELNDSNIYDIQEQLEKIRISIEFDKNKLNKEKTK